MKAKITKRAVDALTPSDRDAFLWDTELPGFGCKVTPKGSRVFVLQYSVDGRARRVTIGRYGSELTVDEARTKARRLRGQVADGQDPAHQRAQARAMPTLAEFAERYLAEHAAVKKKPSSVAADERNLRNHILPVFGRQKLDRIGRPDVARFHADMAAKPGAANRCLALLSKMMNLAEKWGLRPDGTNPTRHLDKYPERKLERFLSNAELARLGEVLREAERVGMTQNAIAAIRLLILTGCRRNEILTLRWEDIDFERQCLRLSDSKSGAKSVPLGAPALELLAGLPRAKRNPYVLPGKKRGQHFVGLEKTWQLLRAKAGLPDVRLHDLRHSYASAGAGLGESLVVIGKLLGHADTATTARYAHLSPDPTKAAADRISGHIAAVMNGEEGEVMPLLPPR